MFPNLLGQKAYSKMTDEDMAAVIGVTRQTYLRKLETGDFTVNECKAYCKHFSKPFDYLFSLQTELPSK